MKPYLVALRDRVCAYFCADFRTALERTAELQRENAMLKEAVFDLQ